MTTPLYLLAKYIPDPRRMEPHNIGIVVISPYGIRARFLGEHPERVGEVDGRTIPAFVQSHSAYRQWVTYWLRQIAKITENAPHDAEGEIDIPAITEALAAGNKVNYCLVRAGELLETVTDLDDLLDELYNVLVAEEPTRPKPILERTIRRMLQEAKVTRLPYFTEHLPVECEIRGGVKQNLVFDYGLKNGKLYRLYDRVSVRTQPKQMESVNAAAWKFTCVQNAGLVEREQIAALVYVTQDQLKEPPVQEALDVLGAVTRVVNIAEDQTAKEEFEKLPKLLNEAHE